MPEFEFELPLLPLPTVLFPNARMPIDVKSRHEELMISQCLIDRTPFGAVLMHSDNVRELAERQMVGTAAEIIHVERLPDDRLSLIARGHRRFRILEIVQESPYIIARVRFPAIMLFLVSELFHTANRVAAMFHRYLELAYTPRVRDRREFILPMSPVDLAYAVGGALLIPSDEKQMLLEMFNPDRMLTAEVRILQREIERLQVDDFYRQEVQATASRSLVTMPPPRGVNEAN
ncbi:MAG TPA: hypothetical protein EYP10_01185 [Armatimonadetes bacterium]|nr:hypothetical protein [Armatimonadota bacterium]